MVFARSLPRRIAVPGETLCDPRTRESERIFRALRTIAAPWSGRGAVHSKRRPNYCRDTSDVAEGAEYSSDVRNFSPRTPASHSRAAVQASIREQSKGRTPVHVRHINCTTSRHGARYGHEHCDLPNNLGLPLEPAQSSAPRRRGTAQAGGALGVRETSRRSARCDRTKVRAVRVLGSRGSARLGLKSMTPQRGIQRRSTRLKRREGSRGEKRRCTPKGGR